MTRVSQAPGGASTIQLGSSPLGTPAKPVLKVLPPPEEEAPVPVNAPVPVGVKPEKAAVSSDEWDALKLKAITSIGQISNANPDVTAALVDLLQKLQASGALNQPRALDASGAIDRLRAALKLRGTHGIVSLGYKFRSMDDDGDRKLSFEEFRKALVEAKLPEADIHCLFRAMDTDCSGYLSFNEVLFGLRGQLNARRLDMVQRAFKVLDKTGDGQVTMADLYERYDASRQPDVVLGTKSPEQALKELMAVFEAQGGGTSNDGIITFDEFKKYYEFVSASVDLDDYFELMIRNAWHISGGEGWCANTTCKRVLVLHNDGSQSVQEIQNDIDVTSDQYLERLVAQGVKDVKSIAVYGEPSDVPSAKAAEAPPPPSPSGSSSARPHTPGRFSASANKAGGADHFRSSIVFG